MRGKASRRNTQSHDIEASNATLKAVLGGPPPKSWMQAGTAPLRTTHTIRANAPNYVGKDAISPQQMRNTALESPTPSPILPPATIRHHFTDVGQQEASNLSTSSTMLNGEQEEVADFQTSAGNDDLATTRRTSVISAPENVNTLSREMNSHAEALTTPSSTRDMPGWLESWSTLPVTTSDHVTNPPLSRAAQHPQVPRNPPNIQAKLPSLKSHMPNLRAYVDAVGGFTNLQPEFEQPRFYLLREACDQEDWFYVVVHQLLCVWDTSRDDINTISGLPSYRALKGGFDILGQLIRRGNEDCVPDGLRQVEQRLRHLEWFARFPMSLTQLSNFLEYRQHVSNVGLFLANMASHWQYYSTVCVRRRCPPLVSELIGTLNLTSAILQRIAFRAIRRNMGIVDDGFGATLEKIFLDDRTQHLRMAQRANNDPKLWHGRWDTSIMKSYQKLLTRPASTPTASALGTFPPSNGSSPTVTSVSTDGQSSQGLQLALEPDQGTGIQNQNGHDSNAIVNAQRQPLTVSHGIIQNSAVSPPVVRTQGEAPRLTCATTFTPPMLQFSRPQSRTGYTSEMTSPGQSSLPWSPAHQGTSCSNPIVAMVGARSNQQPGLISTQEIPNRYYAQNERGHQNQQVQYMRTQQSQNQQMQNPLTQSPQMQNYQTQNSQTQNYQVQNYQPQNQQLQSQPMQTRRMQNEPSVQNQNLLHQQGQFVQGRQILPPVICMPPVQTQQGQPTSLMQTGQVQLVPRWEQAQQPQTQLRVGPNPAQRQISDLAVTQRRGNSQDNDFSRTSNTTSSGTHDNLFPAMHILFPAMHMSAIPFNGPTAPQDPTQIYKQTPPLLRPLIPPLGVVHPDHDIYRPERNALHQAHLRSPHLVASKLVGDSSEGKTKFYQYVKELAMRPQVIPTKDPVMKFCFKVSSRAYELLAQNNSLNIDQLHVREFKTGQLQYRLRCIQAKLGVSECCDSDWIVSETSWPEAIFMEANGEMLEIRRKQLHGKDLPIDITQFITPPILPHSVNDITISMPRSSKMTFPKSYFIAVEVIEILDHELILNNCRTHQRIPASETLGQIKDSLACNNLAGEDDIAITVSDLSINLADPFTTKMFTIPVRGTRCRHRECFDLETFLQTRPSKSKRLGQPCMADVWKCPLCGEDARPCSLRIDGFLEGVRSDLAKMEFDADIKGIWVGPNGEWRPKAEEQRYRKRKFEEHAVDNRSEDGVVEGENRMRSKKSKSVKSDSGLVSATRELQVIELD